VIPPGLSRCTACGKYRGHFFFSEVYDRNLLTSVTVDCLCNGIRCLNCGAPRHRPISNYWNEERSGPIHVPHFMGLFPDCKRCRTENS
jgi:DNA-directed RNA polymerase subunit N (RpoN/RPB10)